MPSRIHTFTHTEHEACFVMPLKGFRSCNPKQFTLSTHSSIFLVTFSAGGTRFTLSALSWCIILTVLLVMSFPRKFSCDYMQLCVSFLTFYRKKLIHAWHIQCVFTLQLCSTETKTFPDHEGLHMECNFGSIVYFTEHTHTKISHFHHLSEFRGSYKCRWHGTYKSTRAQSNKLKQSKYFQPIIAEILFFSWKNNS